MPATSSSAYTLGYCDIERRYRYSLQVDTVLSSQRRLLVVQCNPSLASAQRSDPTVGKVANWALENGFGRVVFLNLFARISPYPEALRNLRYAQLVGERNDQVIAAHLREPEGTLVLAWGAALPVSPRRYTRRLREIRALVDAAGVTAHQVGALTAQGYPRHGRMWNAGNRDLRALDWSALQCA